MPKKKAQPKISFNGRPTKYKESMCDVILEEMIQGKFMCNVCATIFISQDTFNRWIKENIAFSEAYKVGRLLCTAYWAQVGRDNLHDKDFNTKIWDRFMRTQCVGWSDNSDQLHPGAIEGFGSSSLQKRLDILKKSFETSAINSRQYKALIDILRVEADIVGDIVILPHIQKAEASRELAENKITKAEYNQRVAIIKDLEDQ